MYHFPHLSRIKCQFTPIGPLPPPWWIPYGRPCCTQCTHCVQYRCTDRQILSPLFTDGFSLRHHSTLSREILHRHVPFQVLQVRYGPTRGNFNHLSFFQKIHQALVFHTSCCFDQCSLQHTTVSGCMMSGSKMLKMTAIFTDSSPPARPASQTTGEMCLSMVLMVQKVTWESRHNY